ncbi:hypothetical protein [Paracoccus sp. ME4]|uniref:hypothetical protein n=1 Tax=Paracoccus sp. ME4 TaxID=3138066 RepID=UPI00398A5D2C
MKTYTVTRPHIGDRFYDAGEAREAMPLDVKHLVAAGILIEDAASDADVPPGPQNGTSPADPGQAGGLAPADDQAPDAGPAAKPAKPEIGKAKASK